MSEAFQTLLAQSLNSASQIQDMISTKRFKRLRYFAKDGWGNSPVTLGAVSLIFGFAAIAFWMPWFFMGIASITILACAFTAEWMIQNAMQKCFNTYHIVYDSSSMDIAQAPYKLQVLEECKKAGATVEQMQDLQKLALKENMPHGWWEWIFNEAKASIQREQQHVVFVQKNQDEYNALVQIQNIVEPTVHPQPLDPANSKTLKL